MEKSTRKNEQMKEICIRKMKDIDVDHVMKVEELSFTTPWPREIFYQEIVENSYAHYFVVELEENIIGYGGMWVVIDDAQITNIAVKPKYRGYKIGEKLFQHILQHAMQMGVKRLSLEVRASNIIAQRLYRKFGLVPGGVRKNYYTDNKEDAIIMWVNL